MELTDKVKDFLHEKSKALATEFYTFVLSEFDEREQPIESPVEQLFYIEWRYRQSSSEKWYLDLWPQYHQEELTGKYRLDFFVDFFQSAYERGHGRQWDEIISTVPAPLIGIEIDGHIWHEKTKEQVQYHKERERFLVAKGWKLIRFTGREVYRNPEKCVDEVFNITQPLALQYYKTLLEKQIEQYQKVKA